MTHPLRPAIIIALLVVFLGKSPTQALQAEDFQGLVYYQDPTTRGMAISGPDIFLGLPENSRYQGGWLLETPGNDVFAPSSLGAAMFRINQDNFLFFDVIANFEDGRAYNRILDTIQIPDNVTLLKCLNSPDPNAEAIAFLTATETDLVNAQGPNLMDGIFAEIVNPQNLYLLHSRRLRIEKASGINFTCTGFPLGYIDGTF
ncbi:MAG: hypothetical protein VKJ86_01650 [Synechococcus sp.]|nr:hypothetical protein [Synechococcus sp.]